MVIVKDALLREINAHMKSLPQCRNQRDLNVVRDAERIRGGNWKTQQIQRSADDYDETECQAAIGEFIADMQERFDIDE